MLFLVFSTAKAQETVDTQEVIQVEEIETTPVINWQVSYKDALAKAKKENKPLLIYFTGSDWCGYCKVLGRKLFNTEKFQKYSDDKLVLYKADFPRNKNLVDDATREVNEGLKIRYNPQSKYPTLVMVNTNGIVLGSKQGMYMTEYYYPFFDQAIQRK